MPDIFLISEYNGNGGSVRRISQILFTPFDAPVIHLSDQPET